MTQARGFDEFYQACYGRLLRQVALVTTDLADAEDVLQEALPARPSAGGSSRPTMRPRRGCCGWR